MVVVVVGRRVALLLLVLLEQRVKSRLQSHLVDLGEELLQLHDVDLFHTSNSVPDVLFVSAAAAEGAYRLERAQLGVVAFRPAVGAVLRLASTLDL